MMNWKLYLPKLVSSALVMECAGGRLTLDSAKDGVGPVPSESSSHSSSQYSCDSTAYRIKNRRLNKIFENDKRNCEEYFDTST